jgi:hypothetical protein
VTVGSNEIIPTKKAGQLSGLFCWDDLKLVSARVACEDTVSSLNASDIDQAQNHFAAAGAVGLSTGGLIERIKAIKFAKS